MPITVITRYPIQFSISDPVIDVSDPNHLNVSMTLKIFNEVGIPSVGFDREVLEHAFWVFFYPDGKVRAFGGAGCGGVAFPFTDPNGFFGRAIIKAATAWATEQAKLIWSVANSDFDNYRGKS